MKRILKGILYVTLCAIMLLSLGACDNKVTEADFVGEWTGEVIYYKYGVYGNDYKYGNWITEKATCRIAIRDDGSFEIVPTGNDVPSEIETVTGRWSLGSDGIIVLEPNQKKSGWTYNSWNNEKGSELSYTIKRHSNGELKSAWYYNFYTKVS